MFEIQTKNIIHNKKFKKNYQERSGNLHILKLESNDNAK